MSAAGVEALGPACFLISGALDHEEEVALFDFIQDQDRTDWDHMPACMTPSPKTLAFVSNAPGAGADPVPTLLFRPEQDETIVAAVVGKVVGVLGWHRRIKAVSMAAIRYCASSPTIGSVLPPHVDHCNDGSWVFLFSLGCKATFHVQSEGMAARHTFEMQSGDALVFDPSTEAGVLHGVTGVGEAGSCKRGGVLCESRYGVQFRVSFC